MKVLVVAAHPDDEILGLGGTVAAHAARGDEVTLAVMCEGITARYTKDRHAVVRKQTKKAGKILGAANVHLGGLPDQRLDSMAISEVAAPVEKLVQRIQPSRIYTHFAGDINRDHRVLAEAVMIAARPYAAPFVKDLLMFETPSSTEWSTPQMGASFQPNWFVDIKDYLEVKLEAFAQYTAEIRPYPHPRSLRALRERAAYWGSTMNREAAEAFLLCRAITG